MLSTNANSIKTILIQKIESPVNHTVANVTLPDMTSHIDRTTVSYANKCLTLTFSSLTCSADGYYMCIVIKDNDTQIEVPLYLHVQLKSIYSFFYVLKWLYLEKYIAMRGVNFDYCLFRNHRNTRRWNLPWISTSRKIYTTQSMFIYAVVT